MVLIPTGMNYSASDEGSDVKEVTCEECSAQYVYEVHRRASGFATSFLFLNNAGAEARAHDRASDAVDRALENAVDLSACPNCGHFQNHMVWAKRWKIARWIWGVGPAATFVCILIGSALAKDGFLRVSSDALVLWLALGGPAACIGANLICWAVFIPDHGMFFPLGQDSTVKGWTLEEYEARLARSFGAGQQEREALTQRLAEEEKIKQAKRVEAKARRQAEMQEFARRAQSNKPQQ